MKYLLKKKRVLANLSNNENDKMPKKFDAANISAKSLLQTLMGLVLFKDRWYNIKSIWKCN